MKVKQPMGIEELCVVLFDIQTDIIETNSYDRLDDFMNCLQRVRDLLPEASHCTAVAINDFIENFPKSVETNTISELSEFSRWWGRGQMYGGFTRLE